MAANARRVSAAASSLAHRLLSELEVLLDVRSEALAEKQRFIAIAGATMGLVGFALLWLAIAGRPRRGSLQRFGELPVDDLPVDPTGDHHEMTDARALAYAGRDQRRGNGNAR
jgi:hypothetical protein